MCVCEGVCVCVVGRCAWPHDWDFQSHVHVMMENVSQAAG